MEFKGTKGEWSFITTKKGHAKISGDSWESFCKVYTTTDGSRDTRKETQANAKLISSAPDLLEALQRLIDGFEDLLINSKNPNKAEDFISYVRAKQAIEKALK